MSEPTITAEKLCILTGLTDRRHRQIAKQGYFPAPIKSQYQLTPTLQGMFKYYRELGEAKKNKRDAIDSEKHRKLKLENDETEARLTDTEKLAGQVAPMLQKFRDLIYARCEQDMPIAMAWVDVAQGRILGRRYAGDLMDSLKAIFAELGGDK